MKFRTHIHHVIRWSIAGALAALIVPGARMETVSAAPFCPGAPRTETFSGTLALTQVLGESPTDLPFIMYPCEEVHVDVSFGETSPAQIRWGFAQLVSSYGPNPNYAVRSYQWSIDGSGGESIPRQAEGRPFNGALGDYIGVLNKVRLWGDRASDPNDTTLITYSVTVHLTPRPGYNQSGTTLAEAGGPVYDNSVIKLSMAGMGLSGVLNYYKVSLPPQGTLSLTGTLENRDEVTDANLLAQVLNSSGNTLVNLFNKTVSAGTTDALPNPPATFTNPSTTQTVDYYLAFSSYQNARLHSAVMTVHCTVGQQPCAGPPPPATLSLFLDVDGFDVSNPVTTDDRGWYVPCSLKNGTSVAPADLPQRVTVIAAYLSGGAIVPPPAAGGVDLILANVSGFRGIAMNASKTGRDDAAPDFEAPVTQGVMFGTDHTARFEVQCWDYGGHATITASHNGQPTQPLQLPLDVHGNWIADAGWTAGTAHIDDTALDKTLDAETTPAVSGPPSVGLNGDGLLTFEEYRGFVVRGEHRRTNPFHKDLFLSSNSTVGIAFAFPNLPTTTHRINGQDEAGVDEYRTVDRAINFNYQNSGGDAIPGRSESNNQKAVRIIAVASAPSNGLFGQAFTTNNLPNIPNETIRVEVYLNSHDNLKKPPFRYSQTQIDNELRRTLGHEVGHAIHICHRNGNEACPDTASVGSAGSVMNSDIQGTPQTDPRSQYNPADVAQIRLRN